MKSFTDIEQSKKLAEILPIESADMRYHTISKYNPYPCDEIVYTIYFGNPVGDDIPCWSLAALLDVLPVPDLFYNDGWNLYVTVNDKIININYVDNPIDSCYEVILKLKEKGLLWQEK